MLKLNIHEAKTHLSRYLAKLKKGETIILCKRNKPIAEIRPLSSPLFPSIPPQAGQPLPEEVLQTFEGKTR